MLELTPRPCPIGWPNSDGVGAQRPRTFCLQPWTSSGGREAVALAASAGLILDPWQDWLLEENLGETDEGVWAAPETAIDVARQNGKGSFLEARELYGLVILGEEIAHSAHEFKTAKDAFRRLRALFDNTPDLRRHVRGISNTAADLGIEMYNGGKIKFHARTGGGGRGTGGDLIVLDEAFALVEDHMSALVPILSARPNPQTIYTSSPPVNATTGVVWMNIRKRGLAKDPGLFWAGWGTDNQEVSLTDLDEVRRSNPGYGIRITDRTLRTEIKQLGPAGYRRERLGLWPENPDDVVISPELWDSRKRPVARAEVRAFAVDVSPDRKSAAIVSVGWVDDVLLISVVDHRPGVQWLLARIRELHERWSPHLWVIDERSPAATLILSLVKLEVGEMGEIPEGDEMSKERPAAILTRWKPGNEDDPIPPKGALITTNSIEAALAWGYFVDGVRDGSIGHLDEGMLNSAVAGAKTRKLGDGTTWARRTATADITTLVGATEATWAILTYPEVKVGTYDPLGAIF